MESVMEQSGRPLRAGVPAQGIAGPFANRPSLLRNIRNAVLAGLAVVTIALLIAWAGSGLWNNKMTREEAVNAIFVRDQLFGELIGAGNYRELSTVVAPDAALVAPGGTLSGPEGMRVLLQEMQRVEETSALLLLDVAAADDLVLATWTIDEPRESELLGFGPDDEADSFVSGRLLLTIVDHQIAGLTLTTWQV